MLILVHAFKTRVYIKPETHKGVDSTPYEFLIKPNTQSSNNHLRHSFFPIPFQFLAIQIDL